MVKVTAIAAASFFPILLAGYIITTPFDTFSALLSENEYEYAEELNTDYYDGQFSADDDYTESAVLDAGRAVTYFQQKDPQWKNELWLGGSGCGPTSMAIVISTLTNSFVPPTVVAAWAYKAGLYSTAGSAQITIPKAAERWGLTVDGVGTDANRVSDALANGKLIVALMGPGDFTKGGHYIVLRGLDEYGNVYVADPNSLARSNKVWSLALVLSQTKAPNAGGPCWAIGGEA
ncbi:hypothetical protein FACS18949_15870 [Clostridia bacterium]|nr:hypothetical protein FACS189425_02930 [Clostridia bacterium]GHV36451.1 hypothetical protein FACS18949_15870 [Clostridia bacterium]